MRRLGITYNHNNDHDNYNNNNTQVPAARTNHYPLALIMQKENTERDFHLQNGPIQCHVSRVETQYQSLCSYLLLLPLCVLKNEIARVVLCKRWPENTVIQYNALQS